MKTSSTPANEPLHERVMRLRKKKGWSRVELGLVAKCSESVIEKFEQGYRYPHFENITRILLALDEKSEETEVLEITRWRKEVQKKIKDQNL